MSDNYSEKIIKSNRSCCLYDEYFRQSLSGDVYELDSVGFRIWHFSSREDFKGTLNFPVCENSIVMYFCTEGKVDFNYSLDQKFSFIEQDHNIIFIPKREAIYLTANQSVDVFVVILQSDVFFNYFPVNGSPYFMEFKRKVQKETEAIFLNSTNYQMSWDMKVLITTMVSSDRLDECKHIYFKAKIIELLGLQLEQFIKVNYQDSTFKGLKKDEFERIERVKDILSENPERNYTLLGLARSVGTNDATLKKHFKIVYGTTVFNYLNKCRMEKAHQILQDNDYKITQVAEEVGFKYASHFSTAFKKYYGYSPAVIKNVN